MVRQSMKILLVALIAAFAMSSFAEAAPAKRHRATAKRSTTAASGATTTKKRRPPTTKPR